MRNNQNRGQDSPHQFLLRWGRVARGTLPAEAGPARDVRDLRPDGLRVPLLRWEHGDHGGPGHRRAEGHLPGERLVTCEVTNNNFLLLLKFKKISSLSKVRDSVQINCNFISKLL